MAVRATGSGLVVSLPSRTVSATRPIAISTAVPKNGPRQEMLPSAPPSSGPTAMPRPRAASYKITALSAPPLAAPTMVASAVEMNRALPEPHPARKPMIMPTLSEAPASAAKITIRARPTSRVRLAPIRLDTKLVKNIASPVTSR